jgi:electron transport complex protein RnfA
VNYFLITVSAIFVNNIVLTQFLGICPFLGVSNRVSTALGMSAAVAFVMTLATLVSYAIQIWILDMFNIQFMQTIFFILVIASLVQTVELVLKKVSPTLYQSLGVFLPLITTNCAILGVALLVFKGETPMPLDEALVFAVASSIGFGLALTIFAGLREKLELMNIPKALKGTPISLITAGLLSLAFAGFANMVKI